MLFTSLLPSAAKASGPDIATASTVFELRFDSLFVEGRGLSFPCDAQGLVQIDTLSARARNNYRYARAVAGRGFRTVAVRCRSVG